MAGEDDDDDDELVSSWFKFFIYNVNGILHGDKYLLLIRMYVIYYVFKKKSICLLQKKYFFCWNCLFQFYPLNPSYTLHVPDIAYNNTFFLVLSIFTGNITCPPPLCIWRI